MVSRRMTPWLLGMVLTLAAGLASTPSAEAVASITFDQVVQGGTVSYSAINGPLVGTDILFDFLVASGTSADGVYACSSCSLDFTTGISSGDDDGPVYTFAGGGTFVLTGGVPGMGIADGSILLSGTWTSNPPNIAVAAGSIVTFTGNGVDFKNELMAEYLGIDPFDWRYTNSDFSLGQATVNPDGTFSGTITQADLQNIKVPEPGSALLLLLGLGSLAAYRRRS